MLKLLRKKEEERCALSLERIKDMSDRQSTYEVEGQSAAKKCSQQTPKYSKQQVTPVAASDPAKLEEPKPTTVLVEDIS
jgi:hypothetical protein